MKTKELLRKLTDINVESCSTDRAYDSLSYIAICIGADDLIVDFVDNEELESLIENILSFNGVIGVKKFIEGVKKFADVYYLDENDNARNVVVNDLKCLKYELERRIEGLEK